MKQRLYTILVLCMCPFMVKAVSADSAGRVLGQYIQAAINNDSVKFEVVQPWLSR